MKADGGSSAESGPPSGPGIGDAPRSAVMNGHIIPNSHLDREWSMDFQHTRKLTVDFLDALLGILDADPEYTFLLDGQAVPLEDYLEIRPGNEARLASAIAAGRIHAGPWYAALDMNCVRGESIVRNLLAGRRTVERYGPVMKVGYTPFGWGQQAQLPQIYAGFGIETAFFYRGITREQAPISEFLWEGSDGTRILVSRLGGMGRTNFYLGVWRPAFYADRKHRLLRRYHWLEDEAAAFRLCDADNRYDHGTFLESPRRLSPGALRDRFRRLVDGERAVFGTSEIAFLHGFDTSRPDPREREFFEVCRGCLREGERLFPSSLPRYAEALREAVRGSRLARVRGELRHADLNGRGYSYIGNDIISARTKQKELTSRAENLLSRIAEPFAAMARLAGAAPWPGEYLDLAWKQFLKCLPHDTIGGCSIDPVEQDAGCRLRDAMSLSRRVAKDSLQAVQRGIDTSSAGGSCVVLTVFNPSFYPRGGVVRAFVDVPRELNLRPFALTDAEGRPAPCSLRRTGLFARVFRDETDLALGSYADEHELRFHAEDVPAFGYKVYLLRRRKGGRAAERPARRAPPGVLENESLRVEIERDGTFRLADKSGGRVHSGLGVFEDTGECGHAWTHVEPRGSAPVLSRGGRSRIRPPAVSETGASLEIVTRMRIPADTPASRDRDDWEAARRTRRTRSLEIRTLLELERGARRLNVTVSFFNTCRSHRLRILFPTGIRAPSSFAEMPFDVVERPVGRGPDNPYAACRHQTYPFLNFAGLRDGDRCFAVVGTGLREYEAMPDGTLAVTLARGFENGICTFSAKTLDPQESVGSQSPGFHEFRFAVTTQPPGEGYANLYREADSMAAPLKVCESRACRGSLPMAHSFAEIDNPCLILSGVKAADRGGGMIVRLFNPSGREQRGTLRFAVPVARAEWVRLDEEGPGVPARVRAGRVDCVAGPKKIITLRVRRMEDG